MPEANFWAVHRGAFRERAKGDLARVLPLHVYVEPTASAIGQLNLVVLDMCFLTYVSKHTDYRQTCTHTHSSQYTHTHTQRDRS